MQFRKQKGFTEVVDDLTTHLPRPEVCRRLRPQAEEIVAMITATPAFRRLEGITQVGSKKCRATASQLAQAAPLDHTRATHSEQTAAHMFVALCWLGLDAQDVLIGTVGALLHDIGHVPYSHCLEALHDETHETRGQKMVQHDRNLGQILATVDLETDDVIAVMQETGPLGRMQSVMDTLSYVTLDRTMLGRPLTDDFSSRIIRTLIGIDRDQLHACDPAPLQSLLDERARLYRDFYCTERNRIVRSALVTAVAWALRRGHLLPAHLEVGSEAVLEARLREMFQRSNPPAEVASAVELSHGCFDALSDWTVSYWEIAPFGLSARHSISEPFDYRKKAVKVQLPSGEMQELKATRVEPHPHDFSWIVLTPRP